MKRVTSIGGIFFKCKDPENIKQWYTKHLGIPAEKYGAVFEWREADESGKKGSTVWNPFKADTKYFEPSGSSFMINYRVENQVHPNHGP